MRTQEEIMHDIREIYFALEPDALSWDGERSRTAIILAERQLRKELAILEKELGRTYTLAEVWGFGEDIDCFNEPLGWESV